MPAPIGLGFELRHEPGSGATSLGLRVAKPSRAEDQIYDAVAEAMAEGMTVRQFIAVAREAWAHTHDEQAKEDDNEFKRAQK